MTTRNVPSFFFLLLVFLITAAFFGLIIDYLFSVFWAVVLSLLFYQAQNRIAAQLPGRNNLAAGLTLTLIILIVIVPFLLVSMAIVSQGISIYEQIETDEINIQGQLESFRSRIPAIESFFQRFDIDIDEIRENISKGLTSITKNLAGKLLGITQNIFSFLVLFFLMLYILFFFLRDGRKIVDKLVWVLPIGDQKEWQLLHRFDSVARATVKGSLVVAILQGSIGGLLFWVVGIPAPALWGVLMTFLSLLPLGSGIVWIPAAIIFFIQADYGRSIVVLAVGSLIIGLLDNFLRPRLVGNDTKMPDYLILLSTLGGLNWFGISGFVLGPIIAAFFITCWEMLGKEFGE
ncbi:MAG: AI-2E family transporter [Saprospiraceae bacterium]|nr:AI-2E family transporter [Saprospiraceae bacterium]